MRTCTCGLMKCTWVRGGMFVTMFDRIPCDLLVPGSNVGRVSTGRVNSHGTIILLTYL